MNHPVRFETQNDIDWVGETFIRGKLFDIGRYPGAVKDILGTRSRIKGEVLLVRSPKKVFRILDEYEGFDSNLINKSEYRREKEPLQLANGKEIWSWVYWYNLPVLGKRRIRHFDYLEYLKKKQEYRQDSRRLDEDRGVK